MDTPATPNPPDEPGWWQASDGNWYPPTATPGTPQPTPEGVSRKAKTALILGIIGFINTFVAIAAVIVGFQARAEIDRSDGRLQGRKMAVSGIVLGVVWIIITIILVVLIISASQGLNS